MWVMCHEFQMTPSQLMKMDAYDYAFLLYGLEWWRTKEKEAMDRAGH